MTLVVNPAVGCHYFLSGPRLPSQLQSVTALARYQFIGLLLSEHWHACLKDWLFVQNVGSFRRSRNRNKSPNLHGFRQECLSNWNHQWVTAGTNSQHTGGGLTNTLSTGLNKTASNKEEKTLNKNRPAMKTRQQHWDYLTMIVKQGCSAADVVLPSIDPSVISSVTAFVVKHNERSSSATFIQLLTS